MATFFRFRLQAFIAILILSLISSFAFPPSYVKAHSAKRRFVQSSPMITKLTPNLIMPGKPPKKFLVDGSGFQAGAKVEFNGTPFSVKLGNQGSRLTIKAKVLP